MITTRKALRSGWSALLPALLMWASSSAGAESQPVQEASASAAAFASEGFAMSALAAAGFSGLLSQAAAVDRDRVRNRVQ